MSCAAIGSRTQTRRIADGFDEDQQFFLSFGQSQCTKWREERLRTLLRTDPHSPHRFRVNGAVSNLPESPAPSRAPKASL